MASIILCDLVSAVWPGQSLKSRCKSYIWKRQKSNTTVKRKRFKMRDDRWPNCYKIRRKRSSPTCESSESCSDVNFIWNLNWIPRSFWWQTKIFFLFGGRLSYFSDKEFPREIREYTEAKYTERTNSQNKIFKKEVIMWRILEREIQWNLLLEAWNLTRLCLSH